jgi:hypothetical protein
MVFSRVTGTLVEEGRDRLCRAAAQANRPKGPRGPETRAARSKVRREGDFLLRCLQGSRRERILGRRRVPISRLPIPTTDGRSRIGGQEIRDGQQAPRRTKGSGHGPRRHSSGQSTGKSNGRRGSRGDVLDEERPRWNRPRGRGQTGQGWTPKGILSHGSFHHYLTHLQEDSTNTKEKENKCVLPIRRVGRLT